MFVMGAAFDPTGDTSRGDRGGSSLAATLAVDTAPSNGYAYTWKDALTATAAGMLRPLRSIPASESNTGIRDPRRNVVPVPDFTRVCTEGLDDSSACISAVLAAVDRARRLEGVRPMVLPPGFARLSMPEQLFVALNLERVDRGLPAFTGLTAVLNRNAQRGADSAGDPPGAGPSYLLDDAEWAGGSSNGLDAVYGWMYDDGFDSGNLDCVRRDAAGCWGHRKGILDDFGSGANLVMGAAVDASSDTHSGDSGGTSMAVTLAVADAPAAVVHLQLVPGHGGTAARYPLTRPARGRVAPSVRYVKRQIYINPSCSKCRSALSLLDEHHIEAEPVRYLDVPPKLADLERLMGLLDIDDPRLMMRTGEDVYAELALDGRPAAELLEAITTHPILLERPIFVVGDRAVIGRPPERVLDLL